jgi:anaerobic magnesium-protoporphyrin IX monomethyl ester cyclase
VKVLLINPRTEDMISTELPDYVSKEVGVFPPLGLLYVAAHLRANSSHAVALVDMPAEGCSYEQLAARVRSEKPNIVGITGTTHNLVEMRRAADCVKAASPDTSVCIGGPHVEAFPEESLALSSVDYAIRGEGELSFLALVEALDGRGSLKDVSGLIHRQSGGVIQNPLGRQVADLDSLPYPARDLSDVRNYRYVLDQSGGFTTLISSRGCPYRCIFCSTPHGSYRTRSAPNIVGEMEECLKRGIEEIHFVDDTFNVTRGRLAAVSEEILKRNLRVSWSCRARANGLTLDELKLAHRAGCRRIHFGVETGTEEGLSELRKGITLNDAREAISLSRRAGIITAAYFLIGCPHEKTREDVMQTVDYACSAGPDFVMFNILAIYPKTELFEMGIRKKLIEPDYWRSFARDPRPGFQIRFWEEHFSRAELAELAHAAYRRFYLRPSMVLRNLRQIGGVADLRRKVSVALGIISGRGKGEK